MAKAPVPASGFGACVCARSNHRLRKVRRATPPQRPVVALDGTTRTIVERSTLDDGDLSIRVGRKAVDGYNRLNPKLGDVAQVVLWGWVGGWGGVLRWICASVDNPRQHALCTLHYTLPRTTMLHTPLLSRSTFSCVYATSRGAPGVTAGPPP